MSIEKRVNEIIETLRPFLISDGGDIKFIKLDNNIVYIKMLGTCSSCQFVDYTITDVILNAIKEEIPEIEKVVNMADENLSF